MRTSRIAVTALAAVVALSVAVGLASAARPGFVFPAGCCFYEGETVRTVVPPAATPQEGTDPFYAVTNGAAGQKAIVAVAPGDAGAYHGGHWAFYSVTWNAGVTPVLLTSDDAVLAAATAGQLTVTRVPANDFKCPIQP